MIQGAIIPLGEQPRGNWYGNMLRSLSEHYGFNFTTPWYKLDRNVKEILLYGTGNKKLEMQYSSERWSGTYTGGWEGTVSNLMRRYRQTKSNHIREWVEQFMRMIKCTKCNGSRLKKESQSVLIDKKNLGEISAMPIINLLENFESIKLSRTDQQISSQILKEIII